MDLREFLVSVRNRLSDADAVFSRQEMTLVLGHSEHLSRQLQDARGAAATAELVRVPTGKSALSRRDAWRGYVFAFMQRGIAIDDARKLAFEAVDAEEALFEPKQQRAARALADGYTPFDKPERTDG